MGIEEQIDKLIDLGEDIKSRLDRLVGLASDHFANANKMVAEEPAKEPPEPEYRAPVLPWDAGKVCEFSDDDKTWRSGYLKGFDYDEHRHQGAGWRRNQTCSSDRARHRFARIKKEA